MAQEIWMLWTCREAQMNGLHFAICQAAIKMSSKLWNSFDSQNIKLQSVIYSSFDKYYNYKFLPRCWNLHCTLEIMWSNAANKYSSAGKENQKTTSQINFLVVTIK